MYYSFCCFNGVGKMRILAVTVFIISLIYSGCSDFRDSRLGTEGEPCFGNGTCKKGLQCVSGICKENTDIDSGDSVDSDDTGDTGNTMPDEATDENTDMSDEVLTESDDDSPLTDDDLSDDLSDEALTESEVFDTESEVNDDEPDETEDDDIQISECVKLDNPCNNSGDISATCTDSMGGYDCNCSVNYSDNGTTCIADTRNDQPCTGLPVNAEWNTASTISQTWNGVAWSPGTIGYYNETSTTTGCHFKCSSGYHWDGSNCISSSRVFTCPDKPVSTDWNSVSSYSQTWNGYSWDPPDSTTSYNITASTTSCRYICSTGNSWNGSNCVTSTCGANYPNTFGGLCWSNPKKTPTTWADAGTHCSSIGGRRPTISELRKLIQNCPSTQTGGSCGVTDTCLAAGSCFSSNCELCTDATDGRYSVFGDMESLWSSQDNSSYTANAWFVNFKSGRVYNGDKNYTPANYDVRCVK
jgi:hypothetical protein